MCQTISPSSAHNAEFLTGDGGPGPRAMGKRASPRGELTWRSTAPYQVRTVQTGASGHRDLNERIGPGRIKQGQGGATVDLGVVDPGSRGNTSGSLGLGLDVQLSGLGRGGGGQDDQDGADAGPQTEAEADVASLLGLGSLAGLVGGVHSDSVKV